MFRYLLTFLVILMMKTASRLNLKSMLFHILASHLKLNQAQHTSAEILRSGSYLEWEWEGKMVSHNEMHEIQEF